MSKTGRPVANRYGMTAVMWRKWSNPARAMFNKMYHALRYQWAIVHPEALTLPREHWKTIRWNAAFMAADIVHNNDKRGKK